MMNFVGFEKRNPKLFDEEAKKNLGENYKRFYPSLKRLYGLKTIYSQDTRLEVALEEIMKIIPKGYDMERMRRQGKESKISKDNLDIVPAKDMLDQNYPGVCRDQACLATSLLKLAGIDSVSVGLYKVIDNHPTPPDTAYHARVKIGSTKEIDTTWYQDAPTVLTK